MTALFQDLRYALRALARSPGFAAVTAGTLAVAIGANTAIFSVVNAVLLKPLPFPEPKSLVDLSESNPSRGWRRFGVSPANFVEWRGHTRSFEAMALYLERDGVLTGGGEPERISYAIASADLFAVLRVRPLLGRAYLAEDDRPGAPEGVVLAHGFWKRRFGADPSVVGRTLTLDGRACAILGVLPDGVDFPTRETDLWKPAALGSDGGTDRRSRWMESVGRLRRGVSVGQAASEMDLVSRGRAQADPENNRDWNVTLTPLDQVGAGDLRRKLVLLQFFVGVVLAIACANVANLLLARGVARRRELALRFALGASRGRAIRQLLAESALLAGAGGLAGTWLAAAAVPPLAALAGERIAAALPVVDVRVAAFSLATTAGSVLLFGLWPAARAAQLDPALALQEGGRATVGRSGRKAAGALVVAQTALAAMLLAAAVLFARSLATLLHVDAGFPTKGVVSLRLEPAWRAAPEGSGQEAFVEWFRSDRRRAAGFYNELLRRARALPGVRSAAAINRPPLGGSWWTTDFEIADRPSAGQPAPAATCRIVTPGYFATLGIPIRRGRPFDNRDVSGAPPAVIVDERMAALYWPGKDPIGERLRVPDLPPGIGGWARVVGVAGDVRYERLSAEPKPTFYFPMEQAAFGFPGNWGMTLLLRTDSNPAAIAAAMKGLVRNLDPDLPVFGTQTLQEAIDRSLEERKSTTRLLALFALIALALAATGLGGVLARNAAARTHEFGVRLALGALPRDVLLIVAREGLVLTAAGLAVGVAGALAMSRVLAGELFGICPTDPATFASIAAALLFVGLLSSVLPARRATRVSPAEALRDV